jgi:predicted secreted Zn-dependent protease
MSDDTGAATETREASASRSRQPAGFVFAPLGEWEVEAEDPAWDPRRSLLALGVTQPGANTQRAKAAMQLSHSHGNASVQRALEAADGGRRLGAIFGGIQRQASVLARDQTALSTGTTVTITMTESLGGTYDVTGATLEEAANQMNARSEWGQGGARDLRYSGGTVNDDGIVSSVTITGVYFRILPNWTTLSSQSEAVRNEWNRMLGVLSTHETRHVTIARTHVEELRTELSSIHEDDLASTWETKMTALQNAQNEYDTTTTNGQTEGVNLDLSVGDEDEEVEEESAAETGEAGGEE